MYVSNDQHLVENISNQTKFFQIMASLNLEKWACRENIFLRNYHDTFEKKRKSKFPVWHEENDPLKYA